MDTSHQGRNSPKVTAAQGEVHARAEMSKKVRAMKERSKKQGVAKNPTTH